MASIMRLMPDLEGDEMEYVGGLIRDMDDVQGQQFTNGYRARRKDPQMILLLALVGFLGFAGIHRFITGQIGMGLLFLLTGGICFIGTIVDLVNYKKLAFEYNLVVAQQIAALVQGAV